MPYRNTYAYSRFVDKDGYPCNQPPWGELAAVDTKTGDIAWRVPLGSYEELEAKGIKNTGATNLGGGISTAGGLVFIGASNDQHFRAFDSRTGKLLWETKLDADGNATPITYQGRNGKQYVVIVAGGPGHLRRGPSSDSVVAFALKTGD
jgi:quinoprotein glucose dehydrogenase